MPVKPTLSEQEFRELPKPLQLLYVERGGQHVIDLETAPPGYVPSSKLDEFRESNRSLNSAKSELEEKLKAFEGIDPAAYQRLKTRLTELEAQAGTVPETTAKLTEVEAQLVAEREAHRATRLQASVAAAFMAMGGEPRAADFVTQLAGKIFTANDDGTLTTTARDAEGAPVTLEGWLGQQQKERAFLFKPSKGGGAAHANPGGQPPAGPTVSKHDPLEFGKNIEGIAAGRVQVN